MLWCIRSLVFQRRQLVLWLIGWLHMYVLYVLHVSVCTWYIVVVVLCVCVLPYCTASCACGGTTELCWAGRREMDRAMWLFAQRTRSIQSVLYKIVSNSLCTCALVVPVSAMRLRRGRTANPRPGYVRVFAYARRGGLVQSAYLLGLVLFTLVAPCYVSRQILPAVQLLSRCRYTYRR